MQKGEVQIYISPTGAEIQVKLDNDTVWMDAHLIALLFEVNRPTIVKHIQNIYKSGELEEKSTCSILEQVAADGKKRKMNLYNLDIIISVGYRVNLSHATKFRQFAKGLALLDDYDHEALDQKGLTHKKPFIPHTMNIWNSMG
jgi:hypothetical protein